MRFQEESGRILRVLTQSLEDGNISEEGTFEKNWAQGERFEEIGLEYLICHVDLKVQSI